MSTISSITSVLNQAEQRQFIQYLKDRNKRHDTRNIDLFKAILQEKEGKIKAEIGTNAYNVLSKRLTDRLIDFIAGSTIEQQASTEAQSFGQLLVARKLFGSDHFKAGYKVLKRAEKEAIRIQAFSVLNEIYHTYIQYSYHALSPDQQAIFKRFEDNKRNYERQEYLNMAYAVIRKTFQNPDRKRVQDMGAFIRETFDRYTVSDRDGYNFQTLYQIALISLIQASYNRDYDAVNLFFVDQIKEMQGGEMDTERYIGYHVNLLYLVASIYFRKRNFAASSQYLTEMHEQMERFDKRYYKEHYLKYVTLQALLLNFSGKADQALELLTSINTSKYREQELLNSTLVHVMVVFQQGDHQTAKRLMANLHRSDNWYERKAGKEWLMHKIYIEIILHIELGNVDYADSRIQSLLRNYKGYLTRRGESQVLPFLKLVRYYFQHPDDVTTEAFRAKVESGIPWKSAQAEDLFLMCFYGWLKSKMVKKDIYTVTLELMER